MNKNKVFTLLANDIPFEPNYNLIKDKIKINQIEEKEYKIKNRNFKIKFIGILSLMVLIILGGFLIFSDSKINYKEMSNILIYNNDKEFVDHYDCIFVAKVVKELETKQYDGTGMDIPYTFYQFSLVEVLKGKLDVTDNVLCFYGGNSGYKQMELFKTNDIMLDEEQFYLLFANKVAKESKRNNINDLVLSNNNQKIKMIDYNGDKLLSEQSTNILSVIKRYRNIINKTLGNEILNIETITNKKEMKNIFDFVAIIKINSPTVFNSNGDGIYSEIVSSSYSIEILECFKGNTKDINSILYCYGTNYWPGELYFENYVDILENDNVYLLFADICENNINNTRVNSGDLIIKDNYQIISLKNYDINKNYVKQSEEIINVIKEYIE